MEAIIDIVKQVPGIVLLLSFTGTCSYFLTKKIISTIELIIKLFRKENDDGKKTNNNSNEH